jgi:hypothetical protein
MHYSLPQTAQDAVSNSQVSIIPEMLITAIHPQDTIVYRSS